MQGELLQWSEKGYSVVSASIRFIVAWRPKDAPKDEKEHAVLLVNLSLKKNCKCTSNTNPHLKPHEEKIIDYMLVHIDANGSVSTGFRPG